MIINVFSYKKAIEECKNNNNKNWISIRDFGFDVYNEIDQLASNILPIYFDDVTYYNVKHDLIHPIYKEIKQKRNLILFSNIEAKKIIDFANEVYINNNILNIHCWAGRSRSQAIGQALNTYFNLFLNNNKNDFLTNLNNNISKYMPNPDILKILNHNLYLNKI